VALTDSVVPGNRSIYAALTLGLGAVITWLELYPFHFRVPASGLGALHTLLGPRAAGGFSLRGWGSLGLLLARSPACANFDRSPEIGNAVPNKAAAQGQNVAVATPMLMASEEAHRLH
jgi:hypothetical protein